MKNLILSLLLLLFHIEITEGICSTISYPPIKTEKTLLFNYVEQLTFEDIILCQILVESNNNPQAINESETACGKLQIRPCRLNDYNRQTNSSYTIDQVFIDSISVKIYLFYAAKCKSKEEICRRWNGGKNGLYMTSTKKYWNKVQSKINNYNYGAIYSSFYSDSNSNINFSMDIKSWDIKQKENLPALSSFKRVSKSFIYTTRSKT